MKKISLLFLIFFVFMFSSFLVACNEDTSGDVSNTNTIDSDSSNDSNVNIDESHVHSYGGFVITKSPTCTQAGMKTKACSCGHRLSQRIEATGHNEITIKGREATCTQAGLTNGKKCSTCGEILVVQQTIIAKGHSEETIQGKAPTCTETGLTDGKKCSICEEIFEEQTEIPVAHSYENKVCGKCGSLQPSEGLVIYKYETYCSVGGVGSCSDNVIVLPSTYEGLPVTKFSGFSGNLLIEEIVLPDTIKEIHSYAFEDCISLKKVTLGKEVVKIDRSAFSGCINLISVENTNAALEIGDFAFFQTSITDINIEGAIKIGECSFSQCKKLKTVNLGEKLTIIGDSAFSYCESLGNITLNSNITKIEDSAFSGCSSLKSIVIPVSVVEIGNYVFGNCDNLTIYCEAESKPSGWDSYWNSDWFLNKTQVVWGYTENNEEQSRLALFFHFLALQKCHIYDKIVILRCIMDKILVSACLLGIPCRYDGKSKPVKGVIDLQSKYDLIPVCAEVLGGLPTPRIGAEIVGERVLRADGTDVTTSYQNGAKRVLEIARENDCKLAILKSKSPSCGKNGVYDGTFTRTLVDKNGILADLLIKNGIRVLDETEIEKL